MSLVAYIPELDGTPAEVLHRLIRDAVHAEELGYDSFWLTEHHFENFGGLLAAPSVLLAGIAQRTARVRLGIAVSLLSLHHPLSLAEEWATVDVLSNGRLDLGIGTGFSSWEYVNFGLAMDEARDRLYEALEIMAAAWAPGRFDFEGTHYRFRDLQVLPKPIQQPHPPLWAAAVRNRESYEWAGRNGYHLLTAPLFADADSLSENVALYRQALTANGHRVEDKEVLTNVLVYVAPTTGEALEDAGPCYARLNQVRAEAFRRGGAHSGPPSGPVARLAKLSVAELAAEGKALIGSPDECAARLRALQQELGITHFIGTFYFGGMAEEKVRRSMKLFIEEVAPRMGSAAPLQVPAMPT
jgi:natural product biosynthesis luciferase-like monooxygenase protein